MLGSRQCLISSFLPETVPPSGPGAPLAGMQYNMPPGSPAIPGSVVMVYGLDSQRMSCDRIFNLFCSYGNVWKVKFLLNKPGTAMVHMDSPQAAKSAIQFLSKVKLFGNELELA